MENCANAQIVAEFLPDHPAVEAVMPRQEFPPIRTGQRQMRLPGAMIAFELTGGVEAGRKLMNNVRLCTLAVSLGDTEY